MYLHENCRNSEQLSCRNASVPGGIPQKSSECTGGYRQLFSSHIDLPEGPAVGFFAHLVVSTRRCKVSIRVGCMVVGSPFLEEDGVARY